VHVGGIHSVYREEIAASNFSRKEREREAVSFLWSQLQRAYLFSSHTVLHKLSSTGCICGLRC